MTRAHRQWHCCAWLAVAVLLPLILLAGLLARRPVPVMRDGLDPLAVHPSNLAPR